MSENQIDTAGVVPFSRMKASIRIEAPGFLLPGHFDTARLEALVNFAVTLIEEANPPQPLKAPVA